LVDPVRAALLALRESKGTGSRRRGTGQQPVSHATSPQEDLMAIRTTSRIVTFKYPFMLDGMEEEQPPGSYTVETDDELLASASIPAYRRIATLIRLPGRAGTSVLDYLVDIDPSALAAALEKDAQRG
jgi:hypothetical protein